MIFLLSGTKNGNELAEKLLEKGYKILLSFATDINSEYVEFLKSLYKDFLFVNYKKLDFNLMLDYIEKFKIEWLIDATHPFSIEVTKNAINASKKKKIKYIRYEREEVNLLSKNHKNFNKLLLEKNSYSYNNINSKYKSNIVYLNSFKEAARFLEKKKEYNVFFTIGVKNLDFFRKTLEDKNRKVFVKVLPILKSLNKCNELGIKISQIIACYQPWGVKMIKSFIEENSIDIIVTKQSGKVGGEDAKILAALETGTKILIIKRPILEYPEVYYNVNDIIERLNKKI